MFRLLPHRLNEAATANYWAAVGLAPGGGRQNATGGSWAGELVLRTGMLLWSRCYCHSPLSRQDSEVSLGTADFGKVKGLTCGALL